MSELWKTVKRFLLRVCNFCRIWPQFVLLGQRYPEIRHIFGAELCKTLSSQWHLSHVLETALEQWGDSQRYSKLKFISVSLSFRPSLTSHRCEKGMRSARR